MKTAFVILAIIAITAPALAVLQDLNYSANQASCVSTVPAAELACYKAGYAAMYDSDGRIAFATRSFDTANCGSFLGLVTSTGNMDLYAVRSGSFPSSKTTTATYTDAKLTAKVLNGACDLVFDRSSTITSSLSTNFVTLSFQTSSGNGCVAVSQNACYTEGYQALIDPSGNVAFLPLTSKTGTCPAVLGSSTGSTATAGGVSLTIADSTTSYVTRYTDATFDFLTNTLKYTNPAGCTVTWSVSAPSNLPSTEAQFTAGNAFYKFVADSQPDKESATKCASSLPSGMEACLTGGYYAKFDSWGNVAFAPATSSCLSFAGKITAGSRTAGTVVLVDSGNNSLHFGSVTSGAVSFSTKTTANADCTVVLDAQTSIPASNTVLLGTLTLDTTTNTNADCPKSACFNSMSIVIDGSYNVVVMSKSTTTSNNCSAYLLTKQSGNAFHVFGSTSTTQLATGTYEPSGATSASQITAITLAFNSNCSAMKWTVTAGSNEVSAVSTPVGKKNVKSNGTFGMTISASQDSCYNSFSSTVTNCLKQGFTGFFNMYGDVAIIRNGDLSSCPSGTNAVPSFAGSVNGGSNTVDLIGSDGVQYLATFTDSSAVVYVPTGLAASAGSAVCGVKFDRSTPALPAISGSLDLISSSSTCSTTVTKNPCVQNYMYAADSAGNVAFASGDTNPDDQCDSYVGLPASGSTTIMNLYLLKNIVNNNKAIALTATYTSTAVNVVVDNACTLNYVRSITTTSTTGAFAGSGKLTYVSGADNLSATDKACVIAGYNAIWDNSGHIAFASLETTNTGCSPIAGTIVGTQTSGSMFLKDTTANAITASYTASQITITSLKGSTVSIVFSYTHSNTISSIGSGSGGRSSSAALQSFAKTSLVQTGTVTKSSGCGANPCMDNGVTVLKSSDGSFAISSSFGAVTFSTCLPIIVPASASNTKTAFPNSYSATIYTSTNKITLVQSRGKNTNAPICTYTITLGTFVPSSTVNGFKLATVSSAASANMHSSMIVMALVSLLASVAVMSMMI